MEVNTLDEVFLTDRISFSPPPQNPLEEPFFGGFRRAGHSSDHVPDADRSNRACCGAEFFADEDRLAPATPTFRSHPTLWGQTAKSVPPMYSTCERACEREPDARTLSQNSRNLPAQEIVHG